MGRFGLKLKFTASQDGLIWRMGFAFLIVANTLGSFASRSIQMTLICNLSVEFCTGFYPINDFFADSMFLSLLSIVKPQLASTVLAAYSEAVYTEVTFELGLFFNT